MSSPKKRRKKKRPTKLSAANEARRVAREVAGQPKPGRIIPDKRDKPPKHRSSPLKDFRESQL